MDCQATPEMAPADLMILGLRGVVAAGEFPNQHFEELIQTLFGIARQDESIRKKLGSWIIAERQTDIVRNLAKYILRGRNSLVYDVGANDGWFLDRLCAELPTQPVVAFEPLREMEDCLELRRARFPHVDVLHQAVGDRTERRELKVCRAVTGLSSLLEFDSGYHYHLGPQYDLSIQERYEVEVTTLDTHYYGAGLDLAYPSVCLKIDTQGYELPVLQGASRLFAEQRIQAVLIEVTTCAKYQGAASYEALLQFMHERDFVIFDLLPFYREVSGVFQHAPEGRLTEFDVLFVQRDFLRQHPV